VRQARFVVVFSAYHSSLMQGYADVLLPLAPYTETAGTLVNTEGRWQSFAGATPPLGESRPGWRILRVLGERLGLEGFDYASSAEVRDELRTQVEQRGNAADSPPGGIPPVLDGTARADGTLYRIGDIPIYGVDPLVRRATVLRGTGDAVDAALRINERQAALLELAEGMTVMVTQEDARACLAVMLDSRVPDGCALVHAGVPGSIGLGPDFGPMAIERP
jgi:NADH-quinone oxidoreductase subunit G